MPEMQRIVVTGATGFIAKHVMAQLLDAGYIVRGTVRAMGKADAVRETMRVMCGEAAMERFELTSCDLLFDAGWQETMTDVNAVMHLATVVPIKEPKDRGSVIRPALEGTERVLNFAAAAGIGRVVMTSSVAAIGYGHKGMGEVANFSVDDWTDIDGLKGSWTYSEAKVRAEKRAWKIAEKKNIDLTCICPSMVFGPAVDSDTSASLEIVSRLLNGQVPALPPGGMCVVDVRDVAQIHVDALKNSKTIGERIISSAEYISFKKITEVLRASYPNAKIPNATVPLWLMKIIGRFSASVKQIAADLETVRYYDGQPGAKLMGRDYRTGQEATLCAAQSLIELGIIKLPH